MRTIVITNHKGGVGKSTTAINLARALVERNERVLLVDFDPQASATALAGVRPPRGRTVYEVVCGDLALADVIVPTDEAFDLVPATDALTTAIGELPTRTDTIWQRCLREALATVADRYDYAIVDTPTAVGVLSSVALAAADRAVVVTQLEGESLRRALDTLRRIGLVTGANGRPGLNPDLMLVGVLPTFVESRTRVARDLLAFLREQATVIEPGIPACVALREAAVARKSLFAHAPNHRAIAAFQHLAEEVSR